MSNRPWSRDGATVFQLREDGRENLWSCFVSGPRLQFEEALPIVAKISATEDMFVALTVARVYVAEQLALEKAMIHVFTEAGSEESIRFAEIKAKAHKLDQDLLAIDMALSKASP